MVLSTTSKKLEKILEYLLGLFLFLLPWQSIWIYEDRFVHGTKWEFATLGYYGTEALLWITVIIFVVWIWKKSHNIFASHLHFSWTADRKYTAACMLFIFYVFLSTLWSANSDIGWQHALRIMLAYALFLLLFLGPLGTRKAVWWFIAGAAIQSVFGIWQFITQSSPESALLGLSAHPAWEAGSSIVSGPEIGRWLRAYGSFPHPNIFGGYLVISLIFTTWLSNQVHVFHSKSIWHAIGKLAAFSLLFDIQIIALLLTFSRGAWVAFVVFFIGLLLVSLYKKYMFLRRLSLYTIVFTAIFLLILWPIISTRMMNNSVTEQHSISERIGGVKQSFSLIKEYPWLGVGVGGYTATLHKQYPDLSGWQLQPVHNTPLLFFTELGIVGFVLYLIVLVAFISYEKDSIRRDKRAVPRKSHRIAYVLHTAFFIVVLFFDHYWVSTYVGLMMIMIYWAVLVRAIREDDELLC